MITRIEKISISEECQAEATCNNASSTKMSELEYLADIVPQLHRLSNGLGETTLSYLFEMVIIEIGLQLDVEKYKANSINL